jgi:predicted RNase H-like nuclease
MVTGLAGVDGCRGGWLMVCLGHDGTPEDASWTLSPDWAGLPLEGFAYVAVDMPIGLPDWGPCTCDRLARKLLPGAGSTVFPAPSRAMLDAPDYVAANAWGKAHGAGLSKQAWNIIPRIRELDRAITRSDQDRIRETHPELVFRHLAGSPRLPPKKSPEGAAARRALLARAGFGLIDRWTTALPKGLAAEDDLLDACALALAARRMANGEAVRLPPEPERDARGLAMEIWY